MDWENSDGCSRLLHQILTQELLVSSPEEASVIIESIQNEKGYEFCDASSHLECIVRHALREYFDLDYHDVTKLLHKYTQSASDNNCTTQGDGHDDVGHDKINDTNYDETRDDHEEVIGPGECELCERDVAKLTRHHLIPKSTWKRTEPMILSRWNKAVVSISSHAVSNDTNHLVDSDEFDHIVPILLKMSQLVPSCESLHGRQSAAGRRIIRDVLNQQTIDICRPCHDHIHKSFDNRTLSMQLNTLGKLLKEESIARYAKWASRQHRFNLR